MKDKFQTNYTARTSIKDIPKITTRGSTSNPTGISARAIIRYRILQTYRNKLEKFVSNDKREKPTNPSISNKVVPTSKVSPRLQLRNNSSLRKTTFSITPPKSKKLIITIDSLILMFYRLSTKNKKSKQVSITSVKARKNSQISMPLR